MWLKEKFYFICSIRNRSRNTVKLIKGESIRLSRNDVLEACCPITPPWAKSILEDAREFAMEDANGFDCDFLNLKYDPTFGEAEEDENEEEEDEESEVEDGIGTQHSRPETESSDSSSSSSSEEEPQPKKRKSKRQKRVKSARVDLGYLR